MRSQESRLAVIASYSAVVAFVLLAYGSVVFLGRTPVQRDALIFALPSRTLLAEALLAGRVPEWVDRIGIGVPFAANPINGVAYPPAWLAAISPGPAGADIVMVLHLVICGLGAAAFARRLGAGGTGSFVAGATLVASGFVASTTANFMTHLACWSPWVAWAADRLARPTLPRVGGGPRGQDVAVFAAIFAFQVMGGGPAHLVSAVILAGGVVLSRAPARTRSLVGLGAGLLAAIPLAAATVLPALDVVSWTSRSHGLDASDATLWSLSPVRMLEWVWPTAFGPPSLTENLARIVADTRGQGGGFRGPSWSFGMYIGILVFALAAWTGLRNRDERALLAVSAVFVLMALGASTPFYPAFRWFFVPERLARYPEKHLMGAMVLWSALAGAGFTRAFSAAPTRTPPILMTAAAALLGTVVAGVHLFRDGITGWVGAVAVRTVSYPMDVGGGLRTSIAGGASAFLVTALFAVALWLRADSGRNHLVGLAAALLVTGDLGARVGTVVSTMPREIATRVPTLLGSIPAASRPALPTRVLSGPLRLRPDVFRSGTALGTFTMERGSCDVPALFGYGTMPGSDSIRGAALEERLRAGMSALEFGRTTGTEWMLLEATEALRMGLVPVAVVPEWSGALVRVPGPRPRSFVASAGSRSVTACAVSSRVPEQVDLDCDSPDGGRAVLLDAAAPGWTASVDGVERPVEVEEGIFRAVRVPAGRHLVSFRYVTPGLRPGAAIGALSWLLLGGYLVACRRVGCTERDGATGAAA